MLLAACGLDDAELARQLALVEDEASVEDYLGWRPIDYASTSVVDIGPHAVPAAETRTPARVEDVRLAVCIAPLARLRYAWLGQMTSMDIPGVTVILHDDSDRGCLQRVIQQSSAVAIVAANLSREDRDAGLAAAELTQFVPVVLVAESHPLRSLTSQDLRSLMIGMVHDGFAIGARPGRVSIYVPSQRQVVDRAASLLIPGDQFYTTLVVPDEHEVVRRVLEHSNACGVVDVGLLGEVPGARAVAINGLLPDQATYPSQSFWAVTHQQPCDAAERFLVWLQRRCEQMRRPRPAGG